MKKIFIALFICAAALSGCADNQGSGKTGLRGDRAEITMWLIGSEGQAMTMRELAADFYANTGIKVRCDAISWGDAHSKYLTSIAGGVQPDIGAMGLTWGAEFGGIGAMVDLKEAYPGEVASIKDSVFRGLWDSIECGGKIYGIPFDMTEYVMFYRSDIISKPPETWEDLKELLGSLAASGKGMIFGWGSISWIGYSPFLWQAGGDFYSGGYGEVTIDSQAAITALEFFAGLYKKYNVPVTKIPLEQGMRTGDFPIAISGNWNIDTLRLLAPEISGKWSIAMLPKGPSGKRTAFIGGRIIGIFSRSKHKEESWQFIKYLSGADAQKKLFNGALTNQDTYLPPNRKAWDLLQMDAALKAVLVGQALDAKGPPAVANWDACAKSVDDAVQRVILQNADAAKELAECKAALQRVTKK